jgi:tyrosine-protein kinase
VSVSPRYSTLQDYITVLRRQRVLIVLVAVVFAAAAYLVSSREAKVYTAQAAMSVPEPSQDADIVGYDVGTQAATPEQRAAVNAELVDQPTVARRVKKALGTDLTVSALQGSVAAAPEARTNFLVVIAHSGNAQFAATLANEFARQFAIDQKVAQRRRLARATRILTRRRASLGKNAPDVFAREELNSRIAKLNALSDFGRPVQIVRTAGAAGTPSSPRPVRNGVLGLIVGLTLGIVAAFARDSLDRRLRGAREAQVQTNLKLLTQVSEGGLGRTVARNGRRRSLPAYDFEAFRILRTNLKYLDFDHPVRSIAVTSALPEEGKTTVAVSLAWVCAAAGRKTLLIECDLRRPAIAQRLGIKSGPGLVEFLSGKASSPEVLQDVPLHSGAREGSNGNQPKRDGGSFTCITAGAVEPAAIEMLESEGFRDFLALVSRSYDMVILDTSPVLPVGDTLEVIPAVDAVVMCLRAHRTTRDQAGAAMAALENFPSRPTGLVVTGVRPGELDARPGYGYDYSPKVSSPA